MTTTPMDRLNTVEELDRLKDFQRRSLDAVFQRMYLDPHPTRRFLLADEVGLGKTLIARGVITRTIDHLWDTVSRIDVVYLCSNSDIARQNVSRLTPRGVTGVSLASRITLLPLAAQDLKSRRVNIIALTPGTSLDLKGSLGLKLERALLLHMLLDHWKLDLTGACRLFRGNAGLRPFKSLVCNFASEYTVDEDLCGKFLEAIDLYCQSAKDKGEKTLRQRLKEQIAVFRQDAHPLNGVLDERTKIIGELRQELAKSCINALQPDLIILDEFQRFKDLLDGEGPAGEMARQLFEYKDGDEKAKVRVLLLSATPYKMYTLPDEAGEEDHYSDFVRTVRFLLAEEHDEADNLATYLKNYRRELFRLGQGEGEGLEAARAGIERILRKVMVRTERLAVTPDRNGMLVEMPSGEVVVLARDAKSYVDVQRIAQLVEHADTMEYWKAAPWLLNFMDQYKLSKDFAEVIDEDGQSAEFVRAVENAEQSLLPWADVEKFRRLDPAHGRLRWLIQHTLDSGLWKTLWLPPSLRYYELAEPFRQLASHSPTKALLFSAWRVVPRVVAAILSHEAERRMYTELEGDQKGFGDAPDRLGNLLALTRKEGRVAGLTVLSVLYPATWLARKCDPKAIGAQLFERNGRPPTLEELLAETQARIQPAVDRITAAGQGRTAPDESWYWVAPILLDLLDDEPATRQWFETDLSLLWSSKGTRVATEADAAEDETGDDNDREQDPNDGTALDDLVERARSVAFGKYVPSGAPPADLLQTLALMAIAGPATVVLRSFGRVTKAAQFDSTPARDSAAKAGNGFRTLFNQPDSTAIIRAIGNATGKSDDYWKQCLKYAADGCLQAVMDEYAHLLVEEAGVFGKTDDEVVAALSEYIVATVGLKRARVGVQHISSHRGRVRRKSKTMRSRFAMRYGEERADESGDKVRADEVRQSFNSPFWPFVLATTSVGQEGLDFHLYCHKVIHWNLPPNPVDLEQREGRVHRFKGHAVRKNVAKQHPNIWHAADAVDPWKATFDHARKIAGSDLVTYWLYPVPGGDSIERHVPMYPLSRDVERFKALREALALYRMVFGQPRQEEMLSYLSRTVPADKIKELSERLRISLAP